MKLELESGDIIDQPTKNDLSRIAGEEFAILSRDDGDTYMQCAETEEPNEYILEYQDGSLEKHFAATDEPITGERILIAFTKYLNDDNSWISDFQWERMDLS